MTNQPINFEGATIFDAPEFEHFLILQDPEGEQRISLEVKSYAIGRSQDNTILLRSQLVSRKHATLLGIAVLPPLLQVFRVSEGTKENKKSTNGILINGITRNSWVLMDGDEITFSSNTKAIYKIKPEPKYSNNIELFLDCLVDLAKGSSKSGKYIEAQEYLEQILILSRQIYGESHPKIAKYLVDLAIVYYSQNLFNKAESLFLEVIELRTKILGAEHPDVAAAMFDLAAIYSSQSLSEKAEIVFLQGLAIQQKALGAEHVEVASSLMNLATLYYGKKRYLEVKELYERSLKIYRRSLINGHPNIISAQKKLNKINKKLRPKWLAWQVLVPAALVLIIGIAAGIYLVIKQSPKCTKVLPDGTVEQISGNECRINQ
ncbi:MAG: tetratricopeptide repeat protein [Pseudanabaena sp.]|jgi:tetratricopeptide (TPR) repeat protein